MALGRKTGGRRKGTPNKSTAQVKAAILAVYDGLGGDQTFQQWANDNKGDFYKSILTKIVPTEVTGPDGGELTIRVVRD